MDAQPARRNTIIESLGVYLPPKRVSSADILKACRQNILYPLERLTGIRFRRMAGETEFSIDLSRKAVAACLRYSKYDAPDVDLLICCNISRYDGPNFEYSFEPSTSVRLKREFGMHRALCFDISNACAGMFTGVTIADSYLQAGLVKNALVVSGEYITHLTTTAQQEIQEKHDPRMACLTLGDSGAAVMLEQADRLGVGFQDLEMFTLSHYSDLCIGRPSVQDHGGAIMFTDSLRIHSVAIRASVAHVVHRMREMQWPRDPFKFLMHQTARTAITETVQQINDVYRREVISQSNAINNLEERGNTSSTSHFVALWDNIVHRRLHSGEDILFAVQASGVTIGTALYTFDDLPDRLRRMMHDHARVDKRAVAVDVGTFVPQCDHLPRIRIESVGVIPNGEAPHNAVELVRLAGEDCFQHSRFRRSEIGALMHAGVHRDDFLSEPAVATLIASRLRINDLVESTAHAKTFAFDVFNGAIGFLNACYSAVALIRSGRYRNVMVVASEIENNAVIRPRQLLGLKETGSAMILEPSSDGHTGFGSFLFKYFTQHLGKFRSHVAQDHGASFLLFKRDPELENAYLDCIVEAVRELLRREGLDPARIKAVFPPQISSPFIRRLAERLQWARGLFVDLAQDGQDFFTSSIPYALDSAARSGLVRAGDVGLIISVGSGIQVGCATYYF